MAHKAKAGDRVIRPSGFVGGFFDLTIVKRASKTIQAQLTKDMDSGWNKYLPPFDARGNLEHYRLYDEDKVKRLAEINAAIKELQGDFDKIYNSLLQVE